MKKNMKINPQLLSRIMGLMAKFGLLPKHLNSIFSYRDFEPVHYYPDNYHG